MELHEVTLSIDQAARFLGVATGTVRGRLRKGELQGVPRPGRESLVKLVPRDDWLRAEDAGHVLGVETGTVRALIHSKELLGRQDRERRWRVRLEDVLRDPRAAPELVSMFAGAGPAGPEEEEPELRPVIADVGRDLFVRLRGQAEVELLERAHDLHGTYRAAIVAGLRALSEQGLTEGETAELVTERELHRERAEHATSALRELRQVANRQLVDAIYCPVCETMAPAGEWGYVQVDEQGTIEVFHEPHGHRHETKLRGSTVLARRDPREEPSALSG